MAPRTREKLLELFEEQIEFLEASNERFDSGKISEAKRLAVTLRVLFHNTRMSHALIHQLGFDQTLTWVDTCGMPDPKNMLPQWGLVIMGIRAETNEVLFSPRLDGGAPTRIRTKTLQLPRGSRILLDEWWTEPVVRDASHAFFSRKDFVLALSNKEGGAHVDPEISESYNRIAHLNSMGWTFSITPEGHRVLTSALISLDGSPTDATVATLDPDEVALSNPVPFMVRQISHEVVKSVEAQRDRIK
ncbi:hypothetical protein LIX17_07725 [Mycobacterium avium subsp. hominissuis]|uniref:Uncharacterized protein n=2 Tax=Mycobacterium avium TaxID=1764 RepID=A0A3B6XA34_MYCAV|nr:hypothetical protein [Mycobacterium avium]APA75241.1 hypothetical protein KV38_07600 [Mycobacterium avium subsp. hominissuis]AXO24106.1 hypothetical protein DFS55_17125 [Mycobacterium avium subsp. hominissuis]MBG0729730.1 hypothetical protein [Mycobacterium avium]MCA2335577.1 hypothetical protein [Mycobacterium avium]PBA26028.1 hypothetical protein CKJ66_15450 [Mycobacterium avium]